MIAPSATVTMDLRLGENFTVFGFDDIEGQPAMYRPIVLLNEENGKQTIGKVVDIDRECDLVTVSLNWDELT
jgi:hypothetical protein